MQNTRTAKAATTWGSLDPPCSTRTRTHTRTHKRTHTHTRTSTRTHTLHPNTLRTRKNCASTIPRGTWQRWRGGGGSSCQAVKALESLSSPSHTKKHRPVPCGAPSRYLSRQCIAPARPQGLHDERGSHGAHGVHGLTVPGHIQQARNRV